MEISRIEAVDDKTAAVLKQKSPRERLEIAFALWRSARNLLFYNLKSLHPDWDEATLRNEVLKRISHGPE